MNKNKIVFIKKHSNNYFVVGSLFVKNNTTEVKYQKDTYIINLKNLSYITIEKSCMIFEHITNVYFVDVDSKNQIMLFMIDVNIAHQASDLYLTHSVAVQLAKRMGEQSMKEKILFLILGAIAGLGIGISIGMNIMMKKLDTGVVVSV